MLTQTVYVCRRSVKRFRSQCIKHNLTNLNSFRKNTGQVLVKLQEKHDWLGLSYLMVTSSSAEVGWIATTLSKSFLVAPIRMATPKPCNISSTCLHKRKRNLKFNVASYNAPYQPSSNIQAVGHHPDFYEHSIV